MIADLFQRAKRQLYRWRSSITGRFMRREEAEQAPDTTVRERR